MIERRREDFEAGIARVEGQLGAWRPDVSLGQLCGRLLTALAPQPHDDDVCALAIMPRADDRAACPSLPSTRRLACPASGGRLLSRVTRS